MDTYIHPHMPQARRIFRGGTPHPRGLAFRWGEVPVLAGAPFFLKSGFAYIYLHGAPIHLVLVFLRESRIVFCRHTEGQGRN